MNLTLKQTQPKYRQIKDLIIERIKSGVYPNDSFLPSENMLCENLNVGRNTIRKTFQELRQDGIIITRKGQKSIINADALNPSRPLKIAWLARRYVGDIDAIYFTIYNSFLREAAKENANVIFIALQDESDTKWFINHINELDGVVVTGLKNSSLSNGLKIKLKNIKNIVCIDNLDDSPANSFVCTDNYLGGRLAAQHLLDCGCRKIAVLGVTPSFLGYTPFAERIKGYKDVLLENSLGFDPSLLITSTKIEDSFDIRGILQKLLKKHPDVEAIFSLTDSVAIKCIHALKEMNFRVPQDIAVMGFDGLVAGEQMYPTLSTIRQPIAKIGRSTFKLFTSHNSEKPQTIKIKPKLIKRESTKRG